MTYNWPDINLTEFKEANTFANGLLRGSVEFNEVDHATMTSEGNLRFKIDYERNATKTPSFRVEFTEAPWPKRFTDGTTDEYIWEYIFPSDYKKALTPVSIFQMYSRWLDGGGVMCQLELSKEGQITGAKQGQIQMIYNAGPEKYRELTPFNPGPGDRLHFKVTCKHGVDGYLKVEINELIVFDRLCNTVFMSNPEANAQAKWGIYHHALKAEFGPANNQKHLDAGHKYIAVEMSPLTIHRNLPSEQFKPIIAMRHVTAATVQQDNETYRRFLEPNGWVMQEGDYLLNNFLKAGSKGVGTTTADTTMPNLKEGSTIWIDPSAVRGSENLTISNGTLKRPWRIKHVKIRIIPTEQLIIKGNAASSYSPLRLFGPENFDVDLRCVQYPAKDLSNPDEIILHVDTEGIKKNMTIQFNTDGLTPHIKFCGWSAGGGSFAGLRLFESERYAKVSGEVSHFVIKNTISENAYIGSIRQLHAVFVNFLFRNGLIINAGAEGIQKLNVGEGSVIENISVINTGVEYPSSFQNFQRGTFQLKAGGGSFKVRNIFFVGYGSPGLGIFSSGPTTDPVSGETFGVKPGDKIEISNLYYTHGSGPFLQVDKSNVHGAEWIFDNIYVGGADGRMDWETTGNRPYAFLNDVFGATDKIVFNSITTDNSLPLKGKTDKYTIIKHTVVDKVPVPKFISPPYQEGDHVIAYYHTYNQESQSQFYPNAGRPVKYKQGDIAYKDTIGGDRTWWRALRDVEGEAGGPGEGWESLPTPNTNFKQSADSPLLGLAGFDQGTPAPIPTEPTYDELKLQNMELKETITAIQMQLETLKDEATALETKNTELSEAVAVEVQKREAFTQQIRDILTQLES